MEAVVRLGKALIVSGHKISPKLVIVPADALQAIQQSTESVGGRRQERLCLPVMAARFENP